MEQTIVSERRASENEIINFNLSKVENYYHSAPIFGETNSLAHSGAVAASVAVVEPLF